MTTAATVPPRLLILGGGVVGVEIAQAWAWYGSSVTVVEAVDRLISREEPFASRAVQEALEQAGVSVELGDKVAAARRAGVFIGLIVAIGVIFAILMVELNHSPPERLRITSSSMHPTVAVGRIVQLDTNAYSSSPRLGDIVAFRAPVGATPDRPACPSGSSTLGYCAAPSARGCNSVSAAVALARRHRAVASHG